MASSWRHVLVMDVSRKIFLKRKTSGKDSWLRQLFQQDPSHCVHFGETVSNGELHTSLHGLDWTHMRLRTTLPFHIETLLRGISAFPTKQGHVVQICASLIEILMHCESFFPYWRSVLSFTLFAREKMKLSSQQQSIISNSET